MTQELSLTARGRRISGWTDVSVTLRADGFPNSFQIGMTWLDPVTKGAVIAAAGDPCEVHLGNDLVVTGYIDEDVAAANARGRALRLTGRGKCQDLVDCCAEVDTMQMLNVDALTITQELAKPYGIEVALLNGAQPGPQIQRWAQNFTERPAEIIQRLAQNAGLLAYEDSRGRLALANIGTMRAASGPTYGRNVEECAARYSMHDRFSEVACASLASNITGDLQGANFFATEPDPNVLRHRRMVVVLQEVAEDAQAFTIRKAKWEVTRRFGRSTIVTATVDSWRDDAGALWTPNTLVPVDLPDNRLASDAMVLSEVTFRRDDSGTHADLVLLPPEAFAIEPINLLPIAAADIKAATPQP